MSQRTGRVPRSVAVAAEPLRLLPPLLIEAPPGQYEQLMTALRVLFRDHLEEGLASRCESSIDPSVMPGEPAQ